MAYDRKLRWMAASLERQTGSSATRFWRCQRAGSRATGIKEREPGQRHELEHECRRFLFPNLLFGCNTTVGRM
eukprot:5024992-Heterocapsa_arctica.AAC.1